MKDVKIFLNLSEWMNHRKYDSKKNNKENIFLILDNIYMLVFSHRWLTEISVTIVWPI